MRVLIQRVTHATVTIDGQTHRSIEAGLVVYVGISQQTTYDSHPKIDKLARKIAHLRLFEDTNGKINASLLDIQGSLLVISNFTLHGRNKKGTQIDFSQAATYDQAKLIYDDLITALRDQQIDLITGEFGAKMQIDCQLDGPVNLILDY